MANSISLKGAIQKLKDISARATELGDKKSVPLGEVLTGDFIQKCSRFTSLQELFEASGFKADTKEDFAAIPDAEWDVFIRNSTSYLNWQAMMKAAGEIFMKRQLGL